MGWGGTHALVVLVWQIFYLLNLTFFSLSLIKKINGRLRVIIVIAQFYFTLNMLFPLLMTYFVIFSPSLSYLLPPSYLDNPYYIELFIVLNVNPSLQSLHKQFTLTASDLVISTRCVFILMRIKQGIFVYSKKNLCTCAQAVCFIHHHPASQFHYMCYRRWCSPTLVSAFSICTLARANFRIGRYLPPLAARNKRRSLFPVLRVCVFYTGWRTLVISCTRLSLSSLISLLNNNDI